MTDDGELFAAADRLFDAALDLAPDERRAMLDRECAGDAALRSLVERLLAEADRTTSELTPGGGLPDPALATAAGGPDAAGAGGDADGADLSGRTIDRYRVLREIGRGGMAVVWLAERADGEFEHKVALKLIKRGVDTDEVVRRFVRERQIMALASHPDIARLLDGGATEDGRPYFVMEYVDGSPIDAWCDERRLDVRERLRLFVRVARAVGYAHRNLVVHRDIKPSNILVSADGNVKLLDFGIARYLGDDGEEQMTRTGVRFLTPAWASPEQVRGDVVTTASDVYQLGLLLYRLLVGRAPYAIDPASPDALRRSICASQPPRPSAAVTREADGEPAAAPVRIGAARRTSPAALRRELAGDLDTIVLMALRKEPERRYASAEQLVEDIEHYLDGKPVRARADTFGYRLGKFVGRHRVAVGAVSTLLLLLVAFAVAMAALAGRLARERDRANRQALSYERVSEFLVDLFEISDPGEARGATVTAREVLDRGAERIEGQLGDEPEVRARLMDTMGRVYQNLGLYDDAQRLLEQALATRRSIVAAASVEEHDDLAESMHHVGWLLEQRGDYAGAEAMYREALALQRDLHGDRHPDVAAGENNLGLVLFRESDYAAAEPLLRHSLELRLELLGERHVATADSLGNLGVLLLRQDRPEEAQALFERALAVRGELLGDDHPHVAMSLDNLGRARYQQKDLDGAAELFERALALRRRVFGDRHPEVTQSLNNLASVYYGKGDWQAAEPIFREVLELDRETLGERHPDYGVSVNNLAHVLEADGRPAEALPLYRQALEVFEGSLEPDHFLTAMALSKYGACLGALGRHSEGEPYVRDAVERLRRTLGDAHPRTAAAIDTAVRFYESWAREDEAARYRALRADG